MCLFLVVASYSQRVLLYHLVATMDPMDRSLCAYVSSLDHHADTHSTRGIITKFESHTYYIEVLIQSIYYTNNMSESHLNEITAEASKINESINSNGIAECMTTTYRTLFFIGKVWNMRRCSRVSHHMEYAGKVTLQSNDDPQVQGIAIVFDK